MSKDKRREEDRPETDAEREEPAGEEEAFEVDMDSLTETDVRELLEKAREAEGHLDRLQRLRAEHENYRKRMAREIEVQRLWAVRDFVLNVLPVVDNLERALESSSASASDSAGAIRDGVKMVVEMFQTVFKRYGIEPVEALGSPFDPAFHEAAGPVDAPGVKPGCVAMELLRGYVMKDLLIRPSRVLVARGPEKEGEDAGPVGTGDEDEETGGGSP